MRIIRLLASGGGPYSHRRHALAIDELYSLAMPIRLRKLIGAVALIVLVMAWALVAMAVAQFPAIKANGVIEVIYYVVAGLGWVLPAMPLVKWMYDGIRDGSRDPLAADGQAALTRRKPFQTAVAAPDSSTRT